MSAKPSPKPLTAQLPEGAQSYVAPHELPFVTETGQMFYTMHYMSSGCYWTPRRPTYG